MTNTSTQHITLQKGYDTVLHKLNYKIKQYSISNIFNNQIPTKRPPSEINCIKSIEMHGRLSGASSS